ncbi:MAG TPA: 50S ribosomal protein L25, partial [Steroidobacteraceae bacterium]|nr:50S ribosomal protein L25 [Steroidobacteraceae bacterium]
MVDDERFYSSIVQLKISETGQTQEAIVKDIQMHPARNVVVHVDLQRVVPNEKLRIRLPIHFKGEAVAPGVKLQGGVISHRLSDVEVSCLPADLPEYLELDLSNMQLNETKFLADIPLPPGVTLPALSGGRNPPVVSVHSPRAEEPEATAEAAAAAAPAEGAAPAAAAAAAPAAEAKKEEKAAAPAKKEGGKK